VVVLGVLKGPGTIGLVVCPAQEPAAAGAGGTTGPRRAGGVQLLPENLYRGIHRGTAPTGRRETRGECRQQEERTLQRGKRGKETEEL